MEKFEMHCQRIFVIVLAMVLLPVGGISIFLAIVLAIDYTLPDWLFIISMVLMMGLIFFLVYKAMKAWAKIPCEVYLSPERIKIKMLKPTIIFSRTEYKSTWGRLQNVSSNYEPQHQERFYKISFIDPPITITVNPSQKIGPFEETEFGTLLMNYVNKRNENEAPETKIDTTNFYQGTGAKIFTAIVWIILVGFSIAFIVLPETIGGWNIIRFAAFASLWFSAYYINRKKTS